MTTEIFNFKDKSVMISGADRGIGKAVALLFAKYGADIAIIYHSDKTNATQVKSEIEAFGRRAILLAGDVNDSYFCKEAIYKTIAAFGKLDILINNSGVQFPAESILDLKEENIRTTFNANIIGMILLTKAAFPYLESGCSIINTTSATAYQGHQQLLDYSASKGAVVSFTRSLALQCKSKGIRVNAVAPGPLETPFTYETFDEEKGDSDLRPLERNATPEELAATFLFLASNAAAQITGQVLHPNGGLIINE